MDDEETEEILALEGGEYALAAYRTYGGYHAVCTCEQCDEAAYSGIHNTAEEAIEAAERIAREHQLEKHRDRQP